MNTSLTSLREHGERFKETGVGPLWTSFSPYIPSQGPTPKRQRVSSPLMTSEPPRTDHRSKFERKKPYKETETEKTRGKSQESVC